MSQSTQTDQENVNSIVQPGVALNPFLPMPLDGELKKLKKGPCQGTYSDIFRGIWIIDEKETPVCLKMLRQVHIEPGSDPSKAKERFRRRVLRETWIWGNAVHPNIYPFIGYKDIEGDTYLVSPWAEQGSLETFLVLNRLLPPKERFELLLGAARGLAYLHSQNPIIIHGDLKPGNILINADRKAALCDFGVARVMASLGTTGLTTGTGSVGTSGYQAPEIILGTSRSTPKSDVYAMAGVILETMSGKPPFHQLPSAGAVYVAVATGRRCQPCDHPALPKEDSIWSFLEKCWNAQVEVRPSAQGVVEELERSISICTAPAPSYETVEPLFDSKSD